MTAPASEWSENFVIANGVSPPNAGPSSAAPSPASAPALPRQRDNPIDADAHQLRDGRVAGVADEQYGPPTKYVHRRQLLKSCNRS